MKDLKDYGSNPNVKVLLELLELYAQGFLGGALDASSFGASSHRKPGSSRSGA